MDGDNGECYEDAGVLQPLSDSDTTILFRDLEHELEVMVQRYHVPPGDLEKIFQVRMQSCASISQSMCHLQ